MRKKELALTSFSFSVKSSVLRLFFFILPVVLFARDWTVMVYMAADNGLSAMADSDLAEMEAVGSTDNFTILAQVDKPDIGCRRLVVAKDTLLSVGDMGIIDMCDWQTLYNFLQWGVTNCPAKRYFVILWDHGSGWTRTPKRSFGSDWSSGNEMSISNGDLKKGIMGLYNSVGKKIHLLAFDACLMQQVEIAYEMKDCALVQVAAQTMWPLTGLPYTEIMRAIAYDPGINETDLSENIVSACRDRYVDSIPVAISAVNLGKLGELKSQMLSTFGGLMTAPPGAGIKDLRENVQMISSTGSNPMVTDDYIDLGDYLRLLDELVSSSQSQALCDAYNNAIISSAYRGDAFNKTTGLTTWFPFNYIEFKNLVDYYVQLDYFESKWVRFLNWLYDQDDIRPADVTLNIGLPGNSNDFRLCWNQAFDLADVSYRIIETASPVLRFSDGCEDTAKWTLSGFSLSATGPYAGNYSMFSGNASNLANSMITRNTIAIGPYGLLDLYFKTNTEELADSLIIEYGTFRDIHYGNSRGWQNRRVLLPAGDHKLKISYHSDSSGNYGGCYIDNVNIYALGAGRIVRDNLADTSLYIYEKQRGDYQYGVMAIDRYGNVSDVSDLAEVSIAQYAVPFSNPNPFQGSCEIVLDYPDSLRPSVWIFSMSGRLVRKFDSGDIQDKKILWDGKDSDNRDIASGVYFVFIKVGNFSRLGKIARQR